jgi:hypothetical protein
MAGEYSRVIRRLIGIRVCSFLCAQGFVRPHDVVIFSLVKISTSRPQVPCVETRYLPLPPHDRVHTAWISITGRSRFQPLHEEARAPREIEAARFNRPLADMIVRCALDILQRFFNTSCGQIVCPRTLRTFSLRHLRIVMTVLQKPSEIVSTRPDVFDKSDVVLHQWTSQCHQRVQENER